MKPEKLEKFPHGIPYRYYGTPRFHALSPNAKLLLTYIVNRSGGEHGFTWAPISLMASDLGITERSIKRSRSILEQNGFIKVLHTPGKSNRTKPLLDLTDESLNGTNLKVISNSIPDVDIDEILKEVEDQ